MRHAAVSLPDLYAMRAQVDRFRREIAMMRSALRKAYNPNQPRVPEGMPGGGRWADTGRVTIAQVEMGRLIAQLPYRGGGRYCVYRFSFDDIIVPGPNIALCVDRMPWFGVVHGRMLNDN